MYQSTKQRIVGSVVLLVAALILLTVVFDGESSYQASLESRIPAPPFMPEASRDIPARPVILADTAQINLTDPSGSTASEPLLDSIVEASRQDDAATDSSATAQRTITSTDPQLDNLGLPHGWSVRVAAFADRNNADNLVKALQDKELRAYSRSILVNERPLQVVFVGPVVDRPTAQQLLDRLNSEHADLTGKRIEQFEIEDL